MRFYRIDLADSSGNPVYLRSLNGQPLTSLTPTGQFNPGALQIELDLPVNPGSTGDATSAYVKIWGVGLADIVRQADFNDLSIRVYGGMSKGLPLANPNQAGLLIQGEIQQSYGNWRGTEQSLVFIIRPPTGSPDAPINAPFTWAKGTPLSVALSNVLSTAFPTMKQQISISPNLVLGYDEVGYYRNLKSFSQWLNQRTQPIIGGTYQGVQIATRGDTIVAWDGTQAPSSVQQIDPWDLIGQPTWLEPLVINFQTVMRGNVQPGDTMQLPQTIIQQQASSNLRYQDRTSFNGQVSILKVQHFGSFRQPTADAWNTTFWGYPSGVNQTN